MRASRQWGLGTTQLNCSLLSRLIAGRVFLALGGGVLINNVSTRAWTTFLLAAEVQLLQSPLPT